MTRDVRASGTDGFVLLEALVGLILLSLTLGLFALSLGLASRVADAGRARAEISNVATGATVMSGWLASALPLMRGNAEGSAHVLFEGTQDRVSFLTLSTGDVQAGGIRAVTLTIEDSGAGSDGAIVFQSSPVPIGTLALQASGAGERLIGRVASARFSYFGSPAGNTPEQWRDDWRGAERLPRIISVRGRVHVSRWLENFEINSRTFNR